MPPKDEYQRLQEAFRQLGLSEKSAHYAAHLREVEQPAPLPAAAAPIVDAHSPARAVTLREFCTQPRRQ